MNVGILGGTGPAGKGLALRLAVAGVDVVVGSRSAERAQGICDELCSKWPDAKPHLAPGANETAAAAEMVVVATPWDGAGPTVRSLAGVLNGKVVISMVNALTRIGGEFQSLFLPRGSVANEIQAVAPEARVAAALHHIPARALAELDHDLDSDVLVCGDHGDAVEATVALLRTIPGLRPLVAGSLANSAPIEAFTAVLLQLNVRYKTHAAIRITGIDST